MHYIIINLAPIEVKAKAELYAWILLEVLEDMVIGNRTFPWAQQIAKTGKCLVDSVTLSSNHFKAPHKRHGVSIFPRLCHCNLKGYTHAFGTETLLGTMV